MLVMVNRERTLRGLKPLVADEEARKVARDYGEYLFKNGVCLPSDTHMTDDDLKRVCNIIKGLWK